jgi:uncharacterized protein YbjT (DUF2867 family)
MARRALVVGATGLVGRRCVALLARSSAYDEVTCLVRRPFPAEAPHIHARVVDFEALAPTDIPAIDDVYCALGTTIRKAGSQRAFHKVDVELPIQIATLAVERGAARMALVSSVGADVTSSNFYLRSKGELERALDALPLAALHVLRPSFLLGEREEHRPAEAVASVVARAAAGLLRGGLSRYRAISGDDVARAMIAAITTPESSATRSVLEHDAILALAARL